MKPKILIMHDNNPKQIFAKHLQTKTFTQL